MEPATTSASSAMRFGLILSLFGLVVLVPVQLSAQQIDSPYRFIDESHGVGAYTGYFFGDPGKPAVGPHSAPIFGVRYSIRFTGPLSGEINLGLIPAEREVIAYDTIAQEIRPTGQMVAMNLGLVEGGLRFNLTGARTWNGLAPYVAASGGVASNLSGQSDADLELPPEQRFRFGRNFALGVGAGTDVFVSERFSIRLEARDHILRVRVPAGLRAAQVAESIWTNNFAITIGAALHF